jgi:hypothetical protein
MMWRSFIMAMTGLLIALSSSCPAEEAEFREVRWGMTKIEVMAVEGLNPESFAGPTITYRTLLLGKEMYLIYEFVDNKLVDAMYVFLVKDKTDYSEVVAVLKKKYGAPLSEREKDVADYYFKWQTPLTAIEMKPGKGNACQLLYTSLKLKSYVLKEEKKRAIQKEKEILRQF